MRKNRTKTAHPGGANGKFTDAPDELSLFSDPDSRGQRRWREVFGYEQRKVAKKSDSFIARAAPRSSSDSK